MRHRGTRAPGLCSTSEPYSVSTAKTGSSIAPKHGATPAAHDARPASNRRSVRSAVPAIAFRIARPIFDPHDRLNVADELGNELGKQDNRHRVRRVNLNLGTNPTNIGAALNFGPREVGPERQPPEHQDLELQSALLFEIL